VIVKFEETEERRRQLSDRAKAKTLSEKEREELAKLESASHDRAGGKLVLA
jgi:hypothetical protein